MESYKHQYAKETVANWFREETEDDYLKCLLRQRFAPKRGVLLEYPICLGPSNALWGLEPIWDETNKNPSLLTYVEGGPHFWDGWVPSYQDCLNMGLLPITIFDIMLQDEGCLMHAFEIVYKNQISEKKMSYIRRMWAEGANFELHVLDADWVLSQVGPPKRLQHIERYA